MVLSGNSLSHGKVHLLHQFAANEVEGVLAGPLANAIPVPAKIALKRFGAAGIADCDVDASHRLGFSSAARTRNPRDTQAKSRPGLLANAFRKSGSNLRRNRAMLFDQFSRHVREV